MAIHYKPGNWVIKSEGSVNFQRVFIFGFATPFAYDRSIIQDILDLMVRYGPVIDKDDSEGTLLFVLTRFFMREDGLSESDALEKAKTYVTFFAVELYQRIKKYA